MRKTFLYLGITILCMVLSIKSSIAIELKGCPAGIGKKDSEIWCTKCCVFISGKIVNHDEKKFESFLKMHREVDTVVLYDSPGGQIFAAQEIGRIIRRLKIRTFIGYQGWDGYYIFGTLKYPRERLGCYSACVDIWLSGIARHGNVFLGIHRSRNREAGADKTTTLEETEEWMKHSLELHREYYAEMEVPESFIERSMKISSNEIQELPVEYITQYLEGLTPAFDEWLTGRCGHYSDAEFNVRSRVRITLRKKETTTAKNRAIADRVDKISNCRGDLGVKAHLEAWDKMFLQ